MTDFFSGTKPDLISIKSLNDLVEIVVEGGAENLQQAISNATKPASFNIKNFYNDYIMPNLLPIIIIAIVVFFALFRYFSLKDEKNENNKENFNPAQPIDVQENRNSYVDVNLPVLYNIKDIDDISEDEMIKKMKKKSKSFEKSPQIAYCEGRPEREETIYGSDVWINQPNGEPHPLYGNDYVTTTADAVLFNNDRNKSSLDAATNMIFK
jgi:hypothetical protein